MKAIASLFDNASDGVFVLNDQQEIVSWNSTAVKMLGFSRDQTIGHKCWEILQGETPDGQPYCRPNCPLHKRVNDGKIISSFDLMVKHQNGQRILINVSTIPLSAQTITNKSVTLVHLWRLSDPPHLARRRLRIYLLGATYVTRPDGSIVQGALWSRVKVRALLAYLAIQEGQPISRERIIEVLWPDAPYKAALQNLNTTVYGLRRSLEPDLEKVRYSKYVIYEGGQYFLADAQEHWLDIRAFEAGLRRARTETELEDQIDAYKSIIALYRGDFLSDLQGTRVLSVGEQGRYRLLYLAAMEELAEIYEAVDQLQEAEALYKRILALDGCREITAQHLINLLIRQDRRAEALEICQCLTAALKEELNMTMSEEMAQLMARICPES